SVLKNVVVNFPRAEGYSINSHLESANKGNDTYYDTYAYGSGALGGQNAPISTSATYENVLVSSAMPVNFYSNAPAKLANVTSVTYGENETELFYDFGQFTGLTVQQAVSLETSAEDFDITKQKNRVLTGVRRYDDLTAMAADSEYANKLIATGLFKVVSGQLLWHSQTATIVVDSAVDFDAAEGVLKTSVLDGQTIISATANGSEVAYTEGKFVGVPELNNLSNTQNFSMVIKTEDAIYNFSNVAYWGSVIENQAELKAALDYDYSTSNKNNLGFYKLANNIDIDKTTWTAIDYSDLKASTTWNGLSCGAGFAGIFDGCGYTIDFNGTGAGEFGIFGAIATGGGVGIKQPATVKNLAIIEYSQNWKPVLAQFGTNHTYNKGALIENLYVTWLRTAVQAGLIYEPSNAGTIIRNVMVNIENNVSYGKDVAEGGYENMSLGYYGGTLYSSLRRASTNVANITESFVSLGKGALVKNASSIATTSYEKWFKTTGSAAPYTHNLKNAGWADANGGGTYNPELYFGYASNMEYGDTTINRGMKAGFATIAANYTTSAAIAGYYCAECGEVFSLEAGNCTTCSVALTQSANLWREAISYKWEFTKCSTVNNDAASTTGEMVFANTYKFASTADMKAAYNANNALFASFVGDAGNGLWAVNGGALTWVGNTTAA
ncbi:MAG: hypothetical protein IJA97_01720, partial [Clostridia bacterium]|nr:hypothetical protein [Clostridia bacterium]